MKRLADALLELAQTAMASAILWISRLFRRARVKTLAISLGSIRLKRVFITEKNKLFNIFMVLRIDHFIKILLFFCYRK